MTPAVVDRRAGTACVDGVACTRCGGSGRVPLSHELQATLDVLRRYGEATATGLVRAFEFPRGVTVAAVCMRLAALERAGLAASRLDGRLRWYRAVRRSGAPAAPGGGGG